MKTLSEATERLCWTAIRAFLTASSEAKLREFASQHGDEVFYCLCVYFDGHYGNFFLYLNDPDQARTHAARMKEKRPNAYGTKSVDEVEQELKWNCGDFRYSFVNSDDEFDRFWRPVCLTLNSLSMQLYENAGTKVSSQFQELWAETACRVALDLEASDVLNLLKRTPDFRVICVDHDETIADSFSRLERVRQSYQPLPR